MGTTYTVLEKQGLKLSLDESSSEFQLALDFGDAGCGVPVAYVGTNVNLANQGK